MTPEQLAMLKLSLLPKIGCKTLQQLLDQIPILKLNEYSSLELQQLGFSAEQINLWLKPNSQIIEEVQAWLNQDNHHLISFVDSHYPYLLKQIASPPSLLFVIGNIEVLHAPQLAMVGSRHCSSYGEYWAKFFAQELSQAGLVITSGMALGIDGCCHQAVVDIQGQTIAVLGNGLNYLYPRRHQALAGEILEQGGAIISEFLPSQPPIAKHFPQRNRIISGLSLGTFVVEANVKSGSLITANYALEQNREVFALPSHIQNNYSSGCHKLIKEGAVLVETLEDILEMINPYLTNVLCSNNNVKSAQASLPFNFETKIKTTKPKPEKPTPEYPELYAMITHLGVSLDEILCQINIGLDEIFMQLLALEMQGLITQEHGLYFRT